jgi:hypothetical protein
MYSIKVNLLLLIEIDGKGISWIEEISYLIKGKVTNM